MLAYYASSKLSCSLSLAQELFVLFLQRLKLLMDRLELLFQFPADLDAQGVLLAEIAQPGQQDRTADHYNDDALEVFGLQQRSDHEQGFLPAGDLFCQCLPGPERHGVFCFQHTHFLPPI